MRRAPDPDGAARRREVARLDAAELVTGPAFAVFGLAAPELRPLALAETGRVNGVWEKVTLAHGEWSAPAGPFVSVTSATDRSAAAGPDTGAELLRAIDRDRNRISVHAGVDEEEPPQPPRYARAELHVGGETVNALLGTYATGWAARAEVPGVTLTLIGRGTGLDSIALAPVRDFEPYLRGREEVIARLSERRRQRPEPSPVPAEGVAAYRALVDAGLTEQIQHEAASRAGRTPRCRADDGPIRHALWQRAVREQARISGIDTRRANEVVTAVVNHLSRLQQEALWFASADGLREAAIDETLRHAVLGETVRSGPAQQAWARYWAYRRTPRAAPGHAGLVASKPLRTAWLDA